MNESYRGKREQKSQPKVAQRGKEIYLQVGNEWFVYDTTSVPLGSGAMGVVYLGRSCQTNEKVAIKRVLDQYANIPSIRERARLEASLLFRHSHLVEMIGYCECNPLTGPIFIISKLVSGITLDKHVSLHLRNRTDFVEKICQTIYPVLDALDYLHANNIIHMDIKPLNIMLENGANIRLMDMGVAFARNKTGQMSTSGLVGTAEYAAPEQIIDISAARNTIDKTTDLYELGMTLYELLAGANPFASGTMEEILEKQKHQLLPAIEGVPRKVMEVIWKATEKVQSKRFQSAKEFKTALQQALIPESTSVCFFRNPIFIGCVVGVVLTLLLLFLFN